PGDCFAVLFRLYIIAVRRSAAPSTECRRDAAELETSPGAQVPLRMQVVAGRHARRLRRRSSGFTSWVTWGSFHSRNAGEEPSSSNRRARPLTTLKRPQNVGISGFCRAASGPHNCLVDVLTKGVGI